jgi:hypothetical protein
MIAICQQRSKVMQDQFQKAQGTSKDRRIGEVLGSFIPGGFRRVTPICLKSAKRNKPHN